jgi:hypothetical protein
MWIGIRIWIRNTGLNFVPYLGGSGEGEGVGGGEAVVAGPHIHIVAHPTALPGIAVRLQQQHQSKVSKISQN